MKSISLNDSLKRLISLASKNQKIDFIGVWDYNINEQSLKLLTGYSLINEEFVSGNSLNERNYPSFFNKLNSAFKNDFLELNNVPVEMFPEKIKSSSLSDNSVLLAVIDLHEIGKVIVTFQAIDKSRRWTDDNKLNALFLVELIGVSIQTEKKQFYNVSVNESEKQLSVALSSLPVIFWTTDSELRITSTNGAGLKETNSTQNSNVGKTIFEYLNTNEVNLPPITAHLDALKGISSKYEYELNGMAFETFVEPLRNEENEITGCIGLAINITDRKKYERELRKSEHQLSSVFDTVADAIFVLEIEEKNQFKFKSVNQAFSKTTGIPQEAVVGKFVHEIIPPESLQLVLDRYNKSISEKKNISWEETSNYPTGTLTGIVTIAPMFDENENCTHIIGSVKDITKRKKIEDELRKNEERFRLLAESTNIIPWETDAKTFQFTYVGPQAEEILGYPIEDWYTKDFWQNHIHPDDKEQALAYCLKSYLELENYTFEYRMITKNGSVVWLHDIVTVESENNIPITLRGYLIDITSRKTIEENMQQLNLDLEKRVGERTAQLQKTNKELENAKVAAEVSKNAKETFLASMSHEIRTPLNSIIGFQQLLKGTSLNEEQQEFVESIEFAGTNLLVIINDILDLSKIEAGKFEFDKVEMNIDKTIQSVIELIEFNAKEKRLQIFVSKDPAIPDNLMGDPIRLSQVLLNIIGNAIKFTSSGEIKISTQLTKTANDFVICQFTVEDTGIGIPKEKIPIIFERFVQGNSETSRLYGGSGLGLTISKYLIELQGGKIWVESEIDKGSKFIFQLPFMLNNEIPALKNSTEVLSQNSPKRHLKILLAEDVVLNQKLMMKIMQKAGHSLIIAENGVAVLEKLEKEEFDLILMDIQMPIMDGYQATKEIRLLKERTRQSIPIIALTAHASHTEADKCIQMGMNAYLSKPFSNEQLFKVIDQIMNEKQGIKK